MKSLDAYNPNLTESTQNAHDAARKALFATIGTGGKRGSLDEVESDKSRQGSASSLKPTDRKMTVTKRTVSMD